MGCEFGVEVGDGACCSRYALPEALGTMPVLRKILRGVAGFRVRGEDVCRGPEYMGAEVPPKGGLKRRLSAMLIVESPEVDAGTN